MKQGGTRSTGRLIVKLIDAPLSPEAVAVSFAREESPTILESTLHHESAGRYSIFCCDPLRTYELWDLSSADPFAEFEEIVASYPAVDPGGPEIPFVGGWVGYFGYEAGLGIEGVEPSKDVTTLRVPAIRFCLYDSAAIFDHHTKQWTAVAVDWPKSFSQSRLSAGDRLEHIVDLVARVSNTPEIGRTSANAPTTARANMSQSSYLDKVAYVKERIAAGDVYQVNLTQRFELDTAESALEIYLRLRRASPSAYGCFIKADDFEVLSCSPELFVDLISQEVTTRPIKGTRPRGRDALQDAALEAELAGSEKDAAELAMIVDLMRNDIGRVCEYGSVEVVVPWEIEKHPTVFHRVATIRGKMRDGLSWSDLMRATFPGGSITGAPKIAAMQIISELEPTRRNVYCGSIGYLGLDGRVVLNIAIRTMLKVGSVAYVCVGGGIVADSDPEDEYLETLAKARGMFAALGSDPDELCLRDP